MEPITYILRELNFTESEAKVYSTLLENDVCTGYEISKLSGVARSKIYNVLESLLQLGAVTISRGGKSTVYRAVPVKNLTEIIRSRVEENLKRLDQASEALAEPSEDEHIWHIYEWESAKTQCMQLIRDAKEHLVMQIWVDELDGKLEDCIFRKQQELHQTAIILYDAKGQYNTRLSGVYRHGFEQDKLDEMGGRWLLIEADDREMIFIAFSDTGMSEAFYSRNRHLAFFAKEYVFHDAYCLRLISHLRDEVTSEFGLDMEEVRNIYSL